MRNLWFKGVLLALAVAVAGCGQRVQVEIPPKAPVEGIRSIVVLPFDNVTNDAALGYEIEERIADVLRSSGWYESVQTVRHLVALPPGQPVTLASLLGLDVVAEADAAIVGTATYYFEDVYVDVPLLFRLRPHRRYTDLERNANHPRRRSLHRAPYRDGHGPGAVRRNRRGRRYGPVHPFLDSPRRQPAGRGSGSEAEPAKGARHAQLGHRPGRPAVYPRPASDLRMAGPSSDHGYCQKLGSR